MQPRGDLACMDLASNTLVREEKAQARRIGALTSERTGRSRLKTPMVEGIDD